MLLYYERIAPPHFIGMCNLWMDTVYLSWLKGQRAQVLASDTPDQIPPWTNYMAVGK